MKILLPFAIVLIPVSLIGLNSIWNFPVERYLVSYFSPPFIGTANHLFLIKLLLYEGLNALYIFTAISYFLFRDPLKKEKAFHILRCFFCINFLFSVPYFFLSLINFTPDWNNSSGYYAILRFLVHLFIALVLLTAKKYPTVPRINLSDFIIVVHTPRWSRLLHHITDLIILMTFSDSWYIIITETLSLSVQTGTMVITLLASYGLYFFLSETFFRQTPGQLLFGQCVVAVNSKMSTGKALRRSFARLIPFDAFSFLYGGNWHDKLSNTTVVRKNSWSNTLFEAERQ